MDLLPPIHALTWDQSRKLGVCLDQEQNRLPFGAQDDPQPREPHRPGRNPVPSVHLPPLNPSGAFAFLAAPRPHALVSLAPGPRWQGGREVGTALASQAREGAPEQPVRTPVANDTLTSKSKPRVHLCGRYWRPGWGAVAAGGTGARRDGTRRACRGPCPAVLSAVGPAALETPLAAL